MRDEIVKEVSQVNFDKKYIFSSNIRHHMFDVTFLTSLFEESNKTRNKAFLPI